MKNKLSPRGLRIKKVATSLQAAEYKEEWNSILTECSIKLMKLLVKQEDQHLKGIKEEIRILQQSTNTHSAPEKFQRLNNKMQSNLKSLEDQIMFTKRIKISKGPH